jgi:Family of unknown function (DUF6317)
VTAVPLPIPEKKLVLLERRDGLAALLECRNDGESAADLGGVLVAGGGFTVVMSDLQAAAETFDSQAGVLRGLVPAGGPACPDGGGGDIDGALRTVLSSVGELNAALAAAMASHGQKLGQAHANYSRAESTNAQFSQDLLTALVTGRGR